MEESRVEVESLQRQNEMNQERLEEVSRTILDATKLWKAKIVLMLNLLKGQNGVNFEQSFYTF